MNVIKSVLFALLFLSVNFVFSQNIKVMIDAGHGGADPGNLANSNKKMNEKHLNLDISLLLGEYIEKNMKNISVYYTRKTDKFVNLEDRVYLANRKKVDYFISIHANSNNSSSINGCRVHIHNGNFGESKKLAEKIGRQMNITANRKKLGVQDSRQRGNHYFVLENTGMPAVLVECGFMTNNVEEEFLNSKKGKKLIALAIYKGFKDFLNNSNFAEKKEIVKKGGGNKNKQYYKVQIRASTEVIPKYKFKSLDIKVEERIYSGGIFKYKYFVGNKSSYSDAQKIRKKVIAKGFKDAFIIKN